MRCESADSGGVASGWVQGGGGLTAVCSLSQVCCWEGGGGGRREGGGARRCEETRGPHRTRIVSDSKRMRIAPSLHWAAGSTTRQHDARALSGLCIGSPHRRRSRVETRLVGEV